MQISCSYARTTSVYRSLGLEIAFVRRTRTLKAGTHDPGRVVCTGLN